MALHFSARELDNIQKMNHAGGWGSKALEAPGKTPGGEGGGRSLEPPFEDWAQLGPGRLGWPGFGHAGLCWADTPRLGSTGPDCAAARLSLGCGLTPAYT